MPINKPKYRGTTTYFHVMAELVRAAQYHGLTTYQDIAIIMGLPTHGSYMGSEAGYILGEIAEDEYAASRGMLSAVAVGVSGKPGPGFYALAHEMGLINTNAEDLIFWKQQLDAIYQAWKRPIPKPAQKQADATTASGS